MKTRFHIPIILCIVALLPLNHLMAQDLETGYEPHSRILFIFDASNSMAGAWEGDVKINIARKILIEMVDSLQHVENVEMAMRIYGHQSPVPPQDCSDTKLEVPFGPDNASRIRQKLRFITPKGTTPIARSLELSAGDFPPCRACRDIIILITDGVEACDGDPCAVSKKLQKQGIVLKPFVIGIGNDPWFKETFSCLGHYYDAPSKSQFREAMRVVITQALNTTSAQINLLDSDDKPTETNVSVVLYDQLSNKVRYNMIHTLNSKGNPDTISLDQLSTYRIVAQTIPPTSIDSVTLNVGRHNHIGIDAPQGSLLIRTAYGKVYDSEKILVKLAGTHKTINVQEMGGVEKYIVGKYDLEIPVYPLIYLRDVEIQQSYTTTVEIPEPGQVNFIARKPGFGSIYQLDAEGDQNWVVNLRGGLSRQYFYLQPGSYRVVFRRGDMTATTESQIWDFTIASGRAQNISLK
jgi:Ca-activated chloride channel homolog